MKNGVLWAIAQIVNTLDPERLVLGEGLGTIDGPYRDALNQACRE